jgi:phosphopantetheinyl transferase
MPLIFKEVKEVHSVACWRHTEDISFFEENIHYRSVASHPEKIRQQLSSRMSIFSLDPHFPFDSVVNPPQGKPFLPSGIPDFSITHTNFISGAILSKTHAVGIDLERISERILKVESRFLHPEELSMLHVSSTDRVSMLTLMWSVKETVFKCFGKAAIDFSNDIRIVSIAEDLSTASIIFQPVNDTQHRVICHKLQDHWLTYLVCQK